MFATLRNIGFVVLLFYVWYVLCEKDDDEKTTSKKTVIRDVDTFVPTKEWQIVKKGQPIPPGLHVRMNLETGVTEAKLIDPNEKQDNSHSLSEVPQKKLENIMENSKLFKKSDLQEAMKNIKSDEIINPDDLKQMTKKFRKYDELKKELGELNLIPKTEVELLTEIIQELKTFSNEKQERTLRLLEDLDFLVHQIDNAMEFVKQNGFTEIIYKNLNASDITIKSETLKLFSSLVQNNPKVKVEAVETGCISLLLKILSLDSNGDIKSRAVTSLSSLLRRFPYAQLKFVENGGLTVVLKLFDSDDIKIKIKLATLISDLLIERKDVEGGEDFHIKEQYDKVGLENLLLEQGWCENLQKLLTALVVIDSDGHDSIEKCLLSIKSIVQKCSNDFSRSIIESLEKRYKMLAVMDEAKDEEISNTLYFSDLSHICTEILQYLPDVTNFKTEL